MLMKRKEYEKPTMQVVEMRQQPQLLAGSDKAAQTGAEFDDYEDGEFTW